jgi:uncharacterized protein YciU (UPF0263 family)
VLLELHQLQLDADGVVALAVEDLDMHIQIDLDSSFVVAVVVAVVDTFDLEVFPKHLLQQNSLHC